jgi:hypothetical protein
MLVKFHNIEGKKFNFLLLKINLLVFYTQINKKLKELVTRPLLRLMYGEYWFRLSRLPMMVIGSFASYTKTKSVKSAV